MVDAQQGVTDLDLTVAQHLRKSEKPVFLVANKVDNGKIMEQAVELYSIGMGDYFCISSINGSGTGELLDAVVAALPNQVQEDEESDILDLQLLEGPMWESLLL